MFNSFSILLSGDESKSLELRHRCCVEMVTNKAKIMLHRMFRKLEYLSPDYVSDCIKCAKPGQWSSVWMIIALSNLLNIPVKSVYPAVSGTRSAPFKALNYLFKPPFSDPEKGTISIMWTNTTAPPKNRFTSRPRQSPTWLPNHFVPLVDVPRTAEYQPTSSEVNVHIPIVVDTHSHPKTFQSPNRFSIFMEEETDNNKSNEVADKENVLSIEVGDASTNVEDNKEIVLPDPVSIEVGDSSTKVEDNKDIVLPDPVSIEVGDSSRKIEDTENELPNPFVNTIPKSTETCDLSTIIEETEYDDDDQNSEYVSEVQTMEFRQLDEDMQSGEDDVSDEEVEITFKPGPLDKYMEIKDTTSSKSLYHP